MHGAGGAGGRGSAAAGTPIRVMVVDDSAVVRGLITRFVETDPDLRVVASVPDGRRAVAAAEGQALDVIVLDIEMPVMDGLTALPKLLQAQPGVQVIMASTLTKANAEVSMRALKAGAADYLAKPSAGGLTSQASFQEDLRRKVKALGRARRKDATRFPGDATESARRAASAISCPETKAAAAARVGDRLPPMRPLPAVPPRAIAIGASTGGPQALFKLLGALGPLPQPIFVTQHMPPTFTALLAEHIGRQTGLPCAEARDGDAVSGGRVHIAPGDHHLVPRRDGNAVRLRLSDGPPENYCRPSLDPMLRALAEVYGARLTMVMLTGMGSDGLSGCRAVVEAGGHVIAQDEATSVVWGMPGAVARAGLCSAVLPIAAIAPQMRDIALRSVA